MKQINEPEKLQTGESTISHAFKKLGETFRDVKHFREFIKYSIAFLIYNDGIMMLMDNAAIIAGILFGFKTSELIILIIILQIAGAGGAYLFGWISHKQSSKQAIVYAIIMLIAVVSLLFMTNTKAVFYVIGALAGFSLSGVQAVSRTMVSQLSPQEKTTEFFGFLSVAGRTSTFVGPLVFGFHLFPDDRLLLQTRFYRRNRKSPFDLLGNRFDCCLSHHRIVFLVAGEKSYPQRTLKI